MEAATASRQLRCLESMRDVPEEVFGTAPSNRTLHTELDTQLGDFLGSHVHVTSVGPNPPSPAF